MRYTIDAALHPCSGYVRKIQSGKWRNVTSNWSIQDEDDVFVGVPILYTIHEVIAPDGTVYTVPGDLGSRLSDKNAYPQVRYHRDTLPNLPTINEVYEAIKNGNDALSSCLGLTINGNVKLLNIANDHPVENWQYPVTLSFFGAGNGYVGNEAVNDRNHIVECYRLVLDGWINHLRTGIKDHHSEKPYKSFEDIFKEYQIFR